MALARRQLALIHLARARLGLTEAQYRALLQQAGGVRSSTELDAEGFERLMRAFGERGFSSSWAKRQHGERRNMATQPQLNFIAALWREYLGRDDEEHLSQWLAKYHGVSALRFLTRERARGVITALLAMNKRPAGRKQAG